MSATASIVSGLTEQATTGTLLDLCVAGLQSMYLPRKGLFCHRAVLRGDDLHQEGASPRYTMMALLGLKRYEQVAFQSPFPVRDMVNRLVRDTSLLENIGDIGLLLWTCAEIAPELLEECIRKTDATSELARSQQARIGSTMELAWFLTGMAMRVLVEPSQKKTWESAARQCYDLLRKNQARSGFFGHIGIGNGPAGVLRGRIGSFADQVYPIIALTTFGMAFEDSKALAAAESCTRAICEVQGPLGQWWWHYDAPTGRVVQRYPVYSVHQDAMAPMALFVLSDATGRDFSPAAMKGLDWIYGRNELGIDLRDLRLGVIWRSIRFTSTVRMLQHEARFLTQSLPADPVPGLTVLHECRPYHLGWLLYAFCSNRCIPSK